MDTHHEVVVVGAGLQGLAVAKTFLQIEPGLNLIIVDSSQTLGGVWGRDNLYPGLRSNNLHGTFEYTDFPMADELGVRREEHIPGQVIYDYFRQYADKRGLSARIRLGFRVKIAKKIEEGWKLEIESSNRPDNEASTTVEHRTITCTKLIIASGITSSPRPIDIPTKSGFKAPIMNFARFRQEATTILSNPAIQHVAVVGGSKAAYDAVYLLASQGKRVSWIIRASGYGPAYMAPAHVYLGPFRCWLEKLTSTRWLTLFSPCAWGHFDGFGFLRSMLHGTSFGRWVVDKFWTKLTSDLITQTSLEHHDELKKLIPDKPVFWYATGLSILNYPTNIHDYIKDGQVNIIRQDIRCLDKSHSILFHDETTLEVDALVCCTGWQVPTNIKFLPESIHSDLGIPSVTCSNSQQKMWSQLDERADLEILTRFPYLVSGPQPLPSPDSVNMDGTGATPPRWRLWRGIAPPGLEDRSIVFLGMMSVIQNALRAEITSLWAYAYLNNRLDNTVSISRTCADVEQSSSYSGELQNVSASLDMMLYDTALFNRFGRWRYPMGYGAQFPDFVFDCIPYFDLLLRDLGLKSWRKGWGWLGELFGGGYGQEDYRGLVDEWVAKQSQIQTRQGAKDKSE
ncbi:MAG: hypothetical protein Q9191_004131 [Dirinaria sp. TL-2023a]